MGVATRFIGWRGVQAGQLSSEGGAAWSVCLDAASFLSSAPLDLSAVQPHFVVLSFYKIFGYPTGLGALLVRRGTGEEALGKLGYFGGGTLAVSLACRPVAHFRRDVAERMEDGTCNFYAIAALPVAIRCFHALGGHTRLSLRLSRLTRVAWRSLAALRHANGQPLIRFYLHSSTRFTPEEQGPILNFNLLDEDGQTIGFSQVGSAHDAQ